ncbi:MAG: ABC transporter substrate-binding protein [Chloroflexi bacterium]|nr:ABC transporter substrate-binding protein [Chloroflexota bacterium]
MAPLTLKTATGNYGHTMPLKDGSVTSEAIAFEHVDVPVIINAFRRMIRGLEFDVSEMAFSTYLCARAYGVPITAIPIFLVRAFHHGSLVYSKKSGITSPKDLEGRRVGVRGYTVTTGVWARGILASQYDVDLTKVTWVVAGDEHVEAYKAPSYVVSDPGDGDLARMLDAGEIDAAVAVSKSPDVQSIVPDPAEAAAKRFGEDGVYPINHTLVVKNEVLAANPGLGEELFGLFKAAKAKYMEHLAADGPDDDDVQARTRSIVGDDLLPYGIEANRKTLETFLGYTVDQQIIPRKVDVEEVFEPSTLKLKG